MTAVEKARYVTYGKVMRFIKIFQLLTTGKYTVEGLAYRMDLKKRTIYRMLDQIEYMDLGLEQDFRKRYFIVDGCCPLCGNGKVKSIKHWNHDTVEHGVGE